jgi:hypothetical protein
MIGIWGPFYFGHTINRSLPDTIVDNRHYNEGAKLIAIILIRRTVAQLRAKDERG